ncbi:MAG: glucokinase [Pseudomonadota bacterium]
MGDIGGTKTRLAIFDQSGSRVQAIGSMVTLASQDFASLGELIKAAQMFDESGCDLACFGVAGPVRDNRSRITNLPWIIDGDRLAQDFGWSDAAVINDLEAVGWGLERLDDTQLELMYAGDPEIRGNQGILAPGTGLGEAFRVWDGARYRTHGSEGSHADFGPGNPREQRLQDWLAQQYGHVSWERVVSGPGLAALHEFMVSQEGRPQPGWLAEAKAEGDAAAAIGDAAVAGTDEVCAEAVQWFCALLGAEAGNQALKVMATGGVFLGGGIPPRLLEPLKAGAFLKRFVDKGRMGHVLEAIPVTVVLDDRVALRGAADFGLWKAGEDPSR